MQVFRLPHEIIVPVYKSKLHTILPSELHDQGIELLVVKALWKLGTSATWRKRQAIAMQRNAIISTPLNSVDRPSMLSNFGTLYQRRYEQLGDVKVIDSAIRQQFKAVASISCDSTHRPAILMNFGISYLRPFERFGVREDIDFAIDQMLEAVTTSLTPLKSEDRAGLLINIENIYQSSWMVWGYNGFGRCNWTTPESSCFHSTQ